MNFKEIKTTLIGLILWVVDGFYFAMPYFNDNDLWESNGYWVVGLFVGGLLFMAAPDRFINFLFGWLNKKTK